MVPCEYGNNTHAIAWTLALPRLWRGPGRGQTQHKFEMINHFALILPHAGNITSRGADAPLPHS